MSGFSLKMTLSMWMLILTPGMLSAQYFNSKEVLLSTLALGQYGRAELGDVDGDNDLDIIAGTPKRIYPNNGAGDFGPGIPFDDEFSFGAVIKVADINNDNLNDLLTSQGVIINNDGNNFAFTNIPGANITSILNWVDLDGANGLDVVCFKNVSSSIDTVLVLFNSGNGSYTVKNLFSINSFIEPNALGDINNDGIMDIVISPWNGGSVKIVYGQPVGQEPLVATVNLEFNNSNIVRAFDMDVDGDLDLVYKHASGKLMWAENTPDMLFSNRKTIETNTSAWAFHVLDIDGDSDMDIVEVGSITGNPAYMKVGYLLQESPNTYGSFIRLDSFQLESDLFFHPSEMLNIADINGDQKPDIIVSALKEKKILAWTGITTVSGLKPAAEVLSGSVFPNPNTGAILLQLHTETTENAHYTLSSAAGRRVKSGPLAPNHHQHNLSLDGLPAGIYYLQVMDGRYMGNWRLIKAHE